MPHHDIPEYEAALSMALEVARPRHKIETVRLDDALARVVARDVICRKNLPAFDNSAMDGFAVRQADAGSRVDVVGVIYAGDIPSIGIRSGQAMRIMTGAKVPEGSDTIVPIEQAIDATSDQVTLPSILTAGHNLRRRGEEQQKEAILFTSGTKLEPGHIAILSSQGIMAVDVFAPLNIAVVSTGDEIREPWEESGEDEIYNANAFGITAMLRQYGFGAEYVGAIPDDRDTTRLRIAQLTQYDVIISTGGASKGDADFLYGAYVANGMKTLFRGVRIKPGHPTTMGTIEDCFVMALPGNPLAALLNLFALGIPVLCRLQGQDNPHHRAMQIRNIHPFRVRSGRTHLVLGRIVDGGFHVTRDNRYGSGMITPLMESDALAILDESASGSDKGEMLRVLVF